MHIPVLQKEVLEYLDPKSNENFIDCTIGSGGHTFPILEKILPNGRILGIDWSFELIQELQVKSSGLREAEDSPEGYKSKVKSNLILVCDNFVNLKEIVSREKFYQVSGVVFDLGMSSWHLEESGRGFSFLREEPLDMRFDTKNPLTAEKIVNYFSELEISQILKEYGEEQFSQRIAKGIVSSRKSNSNPIKTTKRLVEIVRESTPSWYHHKRTHFATKTFQALRISVNDEIGNLKKALPAATDVLKPGGKLVVISFHSLEDKIVKNFFREKDKEKLLKIITKKPTIPGQIEIKINPRSRSAKLRAAVKLGH